MEFKTLSNGVKMPMTGFGTWDLRGRECVSCVQKAIACGYRLIDTAIMYDNEEAVGRAVRTCSTDRGELFVTTKVNGPYNSYDKTAKAVDASLVRMGLDYIDFILVHEPYSNFREMYRALEDAYREGKVRAVGVSNLVRRNYDSLLKTCKIVPMVNQVESHVYYPQTGYQKYLASKGTVMESWAPFTEGRRRIFEEPVLKEIASAHGVTAGQTALRYLVQNGIVVIPRTSRDERMKENIDLYSFVLSKEEMDKIASLDEGRSLFGWYD